jgi:hypothetical protein
MEVHHLCALDPSYSWTDGAFSTDHEGNPIQHELVCTLLNQFKVSNEHYKAIAKIHNSEKGHFGVEMTLQKLKTQGNDWAYMKQHVKTYQSEKNDSAEIINTLHTDLVAEQRTVHLCFLNFTSCENERLNLKKDLVALHQNVSNEQLKNLRLTDNISSIQFELSLAKLKIHELETEAQLIGLELIDTKLELVQIESQKRSIYSNQKPNTVTELMAESEHTTPFTSVPAR